MLLLLVMSIGSRFLLAFVAFPATVDDADDDKDFSGQSCYNSQHDVQDTVIVIRNT
jgi:hypothetical protein